MAMWTRTQEKIKWNTEKPRSKERGGSNPGELLLCLQLHVF
jgi:hypothetical protein